MDAENLIKNALDAGFSKMELQNALDVFEGKPTDDEQNPGAEFKAKVNQIVRGSKMDRFKAVAKVRQENPELHAKWVAQDNAHQDSGGDAQALAVAVSRRDWQTAVTATAEQRGITRVKASVIVKREQPQLHARFLKASNLR